MVNLRQLMFDKGINQTSMAEILGISQPTVSKLINGTQEFQRYQIDALEKYFGSEVIKAYNITPSPTDAPVIVEAPTIARMLTISPDQEVEVDLDEMMNNLCLNANQFADIIGEPREYLFKCNGRLLPHHIHALEKHYGEDKIGKYIHLPSAPVAEVEIIESFPVLPEEVTTSPNTDIVKYVEENGSELETINPNQLLNDAKVDVAERIKRTSMLPTFQPDDTVFIRFIKDKMKIVDGETYYLDCKNRPTMIRLVKFEGCDKLRLIAKNSQYGDIVIDRTDIINIGVVVALFRMTFGDQYSELEALRREKEAEREKKDSQIDKMLEMMQAQGEQQSKLIDYITKDR